MRIFKLLPVLLLCAGCQLTPYYQADSVFDGGRRPSQPELIVMLFTGGPYLTAPPDFQMQVVRQAQENLSVLGYYNGPKNGFITQELFQAIKAFQKSSGFHGNGRLDKTTLAALNLYQLEPGDQTY